jgi:2-polyprenyl-6-methoxyphenol hydroxylase-like FAD-dependent oxidoreductase
VSFLKRRGLAQADHKGIEPELEHLFMIAEKGDPILISGGGIGGLATAIGLRKAGFNVAVFEKASKLREEGAGLSLWSNAIRALEKLGLGKIVEGPDIPEGNVGVYSWQGETLSAISMSELKRKFGRPLVVVHRARLLEALLKELGGDVVHFDARLVKFEQTGKTVVAHFANGRQIAGSALIGADGLHSVVRQQLFPYAQPYYAGYTAWRGIAPRVPLEILAGELWGYGARFGIVPMGKDQVYWFATSNTPEGADEGLERRKRTLLALFEHWHPAIRDLLTATPEDAMLRNDIYDLKPLKHWSVGRVTLLGDAAHLMTPNLGQGACQALEDAAVLTACFCRTDNIAEALHQYERERIRRTSAIVTQSARTGKIAQWENPLACQIRNQCVKMLPASFQIKQLEAVVGYKL